MIGQFSLVQGKKQGTIKKAGRGRARRKSQQVRKRQAVQRLVECVSDPRMYRVGAVSGNWQGMHAEREKQPSNACAEARHPAAFVNRVPKKPPLASSTFEMARES